jgi:eukaryotic-like serine/threonine-protein kinase
MVRYHFRERYNSAAEALKALEEVNSSSTTLIDRITKISSFSDRYLWLKLIGITAVLLVAGAIGYQGITSILTPDIKLAAYTDEDFKIKLDYPENWSKQKRDEIFFKGIILIPDDADSNNARNNLSINIEDLSNKPVSLSQYTEDALNDIKKFSAANEIIGPQEITVASNQGIKVIFSTQENGQAIKKMQIWTLQQNKAYIITYTADKDKFDQHLDAIEKIIKSFTIQ